MHIYVETKKSAMDGKRTTECIGEGKKWVNRDCKHQNIDTGVEYTRESMNAMDYLRPNIFFKTNLRTARAITAPTIHLQWKE